MATITYIVKVASGKFTIDDAVAPKLTFRDGDTYVFDQADSSNSGHILQFSATSNNSGSSEYTTGVTKTGTPGSAGAKTTIITSGSTTDTLYYYSSGGGTHGSEFSNSGYKTSSNYNFLKPIPGSSDTAEKWGPMINHMVDQIDQNIQSQDLDGATDSGTVAVDLDTQSLTVAGSNGIATSGSGQTITVSGEALAHQGEPHIQLQKLYPAVAGKLLDGSTSHSGDYGTAQSDGRSYYFTSIKGSKPIKDPRIGTHFGSQRHKTKSLQLLEQETATYGSKVYSVDGREWMRAVDSPTNSWSMQSGSNGEYIWIYAQNLDGTAFMEITGYFNFASFMGYNTTSSSPDDMQIFVNGGSEVSTVSWTTANDQPLKDRYIDAASVVQLNLGTITTPKITTLKIAMNDSGGASHHARCYAIELIAQDTTSTANKSKIQIPAQNVVSYGKKHSISATATHYDPFNGFVNDTTLFASVVDMDTSLGLGTATTWGAPWDKGSDNHIRPLNGGRVVKWIDSSGVIKTSFTAMPRNAQNIGNNTTSGSAGTASNEITDVSSTNTHTINFSDDVIDNSLSEVAKTFNYREFGNGAANGGTGATFADASMLGTSADDIAYVMDDGLTSLSAKNCEDVNATHASMRWDNSANTDQWVFTFIGTGISWEGYAFSPDRRNHIYAQNLPYGTHVVGVQRTGSNAGDIIIDGVTVDQPASGADDSKFGLTWITIYQPKMPPIPQDACIIADYMLMADFVKQTDAEPTQISKGTRMVSASRDIHYESSGGALGGMDMYVGGSSLGGLRVSANASNTMISTLPFFGTTGLLHAYGTSASLTLGGSAATETHLDNSVDIMGDAMSIAETVTLGTTNIVATIAAGSNMFAFQVATPIHTSYHYKDIRGNTGFESRCLKEIVGGDRNMEQDNLICSSTGQTWSEITRDTSYLGNLKLSCTRDGGDLNNVYYQPDICRGKTTAWPGGVQKDFALAYDRIICLVEGSYKVTFRMTSSDNNNHGTAHLYLNGTNHGWITAPYVTGNRGSCTLVGSLDLQKGDYVQIYGANMEGAYISNVIWNVEKI